MTVSSAGLLVALKAGEVEIAATFEGLSARITAAVRAEPTTPRFVVQGTIRETPPTADVLIVGVEVSVVGGALDGFTTTSDAAGRFELPWVADPGFNVYFKKRGYEDVRFEVVELPRDAQPVISLLREPSTESVSVTGQSPCSEPIECSSTNPSCTPGAEFPVYHDGFIVILESVTPMWETPAVTIQRQTAEGWRFFGFAPVGPNAPGSRVAVTGGYKHRAAFTGGFWVLCTPYRLVFTHPR